jgi:hypothetical protein
MNNIQNYEQFVMSEVYGDNRPSPWTRNNRARIAACAVLLPNSDKYTTDSDRIRYTIGVLNRIKTRRGVNYSGAIGLLETMQVGDTNQLDRLLQDKSGLVMSTLYDSWYRYNDDAAITESSIYQDQAITEFFREYNSKLSKSVKASLQAAITVKGISGIHKGKVYEFLKRLYAKFPYKETIKKSEFFQLLKKYIPRIYSKTKKSKGK